MRKLLGAVLLLVFLFTLASCGYDEEDIPIFYIKNGTEAYDPAKEMVDNFYLTSHDEAEMDEIDTVQDPVPEDTEGADKGTAVTEDIDLPLQTEPYDDTERISAATTLEYDDVAPEVYWVSGGEVWHTTDKCSTLARSKRILSGSIEDAMLAGKARECKKCGK